MKKMNMIDFVQNHYSQYGKQIFDRYERDVLGCSLTGLFEFMSGKPYNERQFLRKKWDAQSISICCSRYICKLTEEKLQEGIFSEHNLFRGRFGLISILVPNEQRLRLFDVDQFLYNGEYPSTASVAEMEKRCDEKSTHQFVIYTYDEITNRIADVVPCRTLKDARLRLVLSKSTPIQICEMVTERNVGDVNVKRIVDRVLTQIQLERYICSKSVSIEC
ncbi:hypothetical protein [Vibrio tritonius]|uniref:hypothetical protein n=1 Tax=Vibrio tritonius TaxID=1435069 RepID=UPI00315DBBCB